MSAQDRRRVKITKFEEWAARLRNGKSGVREPAVIEVLEYLYEIDAQLCGMAFEIDGIGATEAHRDMLIAACEEAASEIEYAHSDMLKEAARNHPYGSGWARVYDRLKAAVYGANCDDDSKWDDLLMEATEMATKVFNEKSPTSNFDNRKWYASTLGHFVSLLIDSGQDPAVVFRVTSRTESDEQGQFCETFELTILPNGYVTDSIEEHDASVHKTLSKLLSRGLVR